MELLIASALCLFALGHALAALDLRGRDGRSAGRSLERATGGIALLAGLAAIGWLVGDQTPRSVSALPEIWAPAGTGTALGLRYDGSSAMMSVLVATIGWVVVRYARRYLDGDPGRARFLRALVGTLAGILLFVFAGDLVTMGLAWIGVAAGLSPLLRHRSERRVAREAARARRFADQLVVVCLTGAAALALAATGSADLARLAELARSDPGATWVAPLAALVALAALAMSVQLPLHGWLIDSMDTPTPLSALLHAGVVNAGGLLLIRSSGLLVEAPGVMVAIAGVGAVSAVFGGLVMLTQTDVKRKLGYSTVAQMGFMVMQCGLGAFSAAALHIVAHALYKAYAFLSSGSHVAAVPRVGEAGPATGIVPSPRRVLIAFATGVALASSAVVVMTAIAGSPLLAKPGGLVIAAVLALGLGQMLALEWETKHTTRRPLGALVFVLALPFAYAGLLRGVEWAIQGGVSGALEGTPGASFQAGIAALFLAAALVQVAARCAPDHPSVARLHVLLRSGLMLEALQRRVFGESVPRPKADQGPPGGARPHPTPVNAPAIHTGGSIR